MIYVVSVDKRPLVGRDGKVDIIDNRAEAIRVVSALRSMGDEKIAVSVYKGRAGAYEFVESIRC